MIVEPASGASSSTVCRIKLIPSTRARAFGCPRRAENPAASTTRRRTGLVAEFVGIIRGMAIPATLQRGPFLAPIGVAALIAMVGVLIMVVAAWLLITGESTTIIVVRHAEKVVDASSDPPLTAQGQARAELLARMFGDSRLKNHVDAIYVSPALRDRLTAAPLAGRLGIDPAVIAQNNPRALARRMLSEHTGGRILVVGHADTVPAIVAALSGAKDVAPMGDADYGTLYIVTVPRIGRVSILSEHY